MNSEDRLVAHANTFHTFTFDEALRGIREAGYRQIELSAVVGWTEHVNLHDDPDAVRARVGEHGLTAVALSGHSDLTTDGGVRYAMEAVQWAAAYGLTSFTTAIGGHAQRDEDLDAFLDRFAPVVETAETSGVIVALEIHGELMASGRLARPIIERIGSPNVRVKYDTANCEYYGGVRAQTDFPEIADLVVSVDAKDHIGGRGIWNFPPPGAGDLDWDALGQTFRQCGYSGPLCVEVEFVDQVWPDYAGVVSALRLARETLTAKVTGESAS